MKSKKKSKLQQAQDKAQAAINLTNKTIEELGSHTSGLYESLTSIQELFDKIRNVPSDKKLQYEELKQIRLNWKQQAEKIEKDYQEAAIKNALEYSLSKTFIIEEFIEKQGASTDTDSFSINGELVFCSFNDLWFDENASNPYTPVAYSWPATMANESQKDLRKELQRLIHLLEMKTSIYNIETRLGVDGKPYIMEMTPRAGGNRLSEILKLACGQDLVAAAVRGALGMEVQSLTDPVYNGWWGECILHSNSDGRFHSLQFNNEIKNNIVETDVWVKAGDYVHKFSGANETIGTLVIRCDTHAELLEKIKNIGRLVTVITQPE